MTTPQSNFEIVNDIAYPGPLKAMFPFDKMQVGEAFEVPKNMRLLCRESIMAYRYQESLKTIKLARSKGRLATLKINRRFIMRRIDDNIVMC